MRPRLRLYTGDDDDEGSLAVETPTVPMAFGEFVQIVADAGRVDRTWVRDFRNDEIRVPEDLYEVLTAYWRMRPGA
jgi:hypothetical protein